MYEVFESLVYELLFNDVCDNNYTVLVKQRVYGAWSQND